MSRHTGQHAWLRTPGEDSQRSITRNCAQDCTNSLQSIDRHRDQWHSLDLWRRRCSVTHAGNAPVSIESFSSVAGSP